MKPKKIFAGDRLQRLREGRGISQAELVRQLDPSASYPNQIENDHRSLAFTDETCKRSDVDMRAAGRIGVAGPALVMPSNIKD
jgi:transcriptional regulator with XRE-family HTH domain